MEFDIVLASSSPRRRQLLEEAGVSFRVHAVDVDESLDGDLASNPPEAVKRLAERKAHAAVEQIVDAEYRGDLLVIGSDTMVALGSSALGKPADAADARRMLGELSGRTHQVHTAVSLWGVSAGDGDELGVYYRTFVDTTHVTFRAISPDEIEAYIATGDPFDKAGAYGIQSGAGVFVERVEGALDTVIGLPVQRLLEEYGELFGA